MSPESLLELALDALRSDPAPWLWAGAALLGVVAVVAAGAIGLRIGRARARGLEDRFQALAAEALRANNEGFLALAGERFRSLQETASVDLSGRHEAIEQLVAPLAESLTAYQHEAKSLERQRADEASRLDDRVRVLAAETSKLSHTLRSPGARGRWGELTLRRTVELAGLSAHCDFAEQVSLESGARPDLVVQLPAGRAIAIDAKAPLEAFLEAAEADGEDDRRRALVQHARRVRRHVDALAGRDYADHLGGSPDFVVLFLPDDGFLAAAVVEDRAIVDYALSRGVVPATPATLYALLAAVAQGWREARLAESTQVVLEHARELDERLALFAEHLGRLGGSLEKSVAQFNAAVGSFETRLLPQARRMRELGVEGRKPLAPPTPIDTTPRRTA